MSSYTCARCGQPCSERGHNICPGYARCQDCDNDGRCRRREPHEYRTVSGSQPNPSHDAYGNPYSDHPCCNCGGSKQLQCRHPTAMLKSRIASPDYNMSAGQVLWEFKCQDCDMRWFSIPGNTRIHSGMFDVLTDTIQSYLSSLADPNRASIFKQAAIDQMNQYLDWRPASEKQGPPDDAVIDDIVMLHKITELRIKPHQQIKFISCSCGFFTTEEPQYIMHIAEVTLKARK